MNIAETNKNINQNIVKTCIDNYNKDHISVTKPNVVTSPNVSTKSNVITNPNKKSSDFFSNAKDVMVNLIPIYGTINEFKKGNTGWGIVGVITDALILVPVFGYGIKVVATLARGGAKVAENAIKAKTIINDFKVLQESSRSIKDEISSVKTETMGTKYVDNSNFAKDKNIISNTALEEKILVQNPSKKIEWKPVVKSNLSKRLDSFGQHLFLDFLMLKHNEIFKGLKDATKSSKFVINGNDIASKDSFDMLKSLIKIFPNDFKKIQLISSFAQEGIFINKPFAHKIANIEHINETMKGKTSYYIDTLENGELKLTAKYEGNNINNKNFGVKVEGNISTNKPAKLQYSYYS
ncbi:hypothetical protein [Candidatus Liberibacter americanus]|nr:hypothetical protein [Candidatus Liberibacter americanus]EMS36066.1 hypothetical protein G653_03101 [Candidatus Liberibacter americanus PW_SP]